MLDRNRLREKLAVHKFRHLPRFRFVVLGVLIASAPAISLSQETSREFAGNKAAPIRLEYATNELMSKQAPHLSCGFRTLQRRLLYADLGLIVEAVGGQKKDESLTRNVVVRHVIKPSDVAAIGVGQVLNISNPSGNGRWRFALVFSARGKDSRATITEIQRISAAAVAYFAKLSTLTSCESRLRFLLKSEVSTDEIVSSEAFSEMEALPQDELDRVSAEGLREPVLRRLAVPDLTPRRRHLYLKLLGFVGNTSDLELLETYIFSATGEKVDFLGTAARAYLRLGGERAGHKLVAHFFTKPLPKFSTDAQRAVQWKRIYLAWDAVRKVSPDIAKSAKVAQFLLKHTVFGDLALADALQAGDDRLVSLAIDTYHHKDIAPYLRIETIVYVAGFMEHENTAGKRKQLKRFLDLVRMSEPELYKQALDRLEFRRRISRPVD